MGQTQQEDFHCLLQGIPFDLQLLVDELRLPQPVSPFRVIPVILYSVGAAADRRYLNIVVRGRKMAAAARSVGEPLCPPTTVAGRRLLTIRVIIVRHTISS